MKRKFFALFCVLLLCRPAFAEAPVGIAATVNDDVVTLTELDNRVQLYLSTMPGTPPVEMLRRMRAQILDKLIDEKLQLHEAKVLGVAIDEATLSGAFEQVARQNKFTPEEFKGRLAARGVNISTLKDQLRAELAWGQVVRRRLRPQVNVSDDDIDTALDRQHRQGQHAQYHIAEIFLPVASSAQDNDVRQAALQLADQIHHGVRFSDVARRFSQAPGAANGGDLGWVEDGQLDPKIDAALGTLEPGQMSAPVRTDRGYHLILMRERQAAGQAPAAPKNDTQVRDNVATQLGMQRLDKMQQRYLRDLRATAFIDKRI